MSKKEYIGGQASPGSCLVAIFGLCFLPLFPLGTAFGIWVIYSANNMGSKAICGNCKNPVTEESRMCPVCRATLN